MLTRALRLVALAAGLSAFLPGTAAAADRGAPQRELANGEPVPGEVLVGFERGASGSERAAARRAADVTVERALLVDGVQLLKTTRGESVDAAIARLERDPNVAYAEPNRWRTASATVPNDALFGRLWGLDNTGQLVDGTTGVADKDIDAPEAWDMFTGGDTLVAVVDEGIAYDHPDLAPNVWTNPGEVAGNGLDDDGNGRADDIHGFDFVDNDGDPRDFGGHGTHVAGTIAAAGGNGIGVTGVSWTARLMAVRGLGPTGGSDAQIANAFEYAADNGARVVNASLGGPGSSATLHAPIANHPETLFVVAAGNDGANNETSPDGQFPCNFTDANLICVAATTQSDGLAGFSNFGTTSVDLGAPGTNILSTAPDRGRSVMSEGFESDDFATRWNAHVDSLSGQAWGRTSAFAATGGFSITDSPTGNYGANVQSYADLRTNLDLSGIGGCILTFKARIALGSGDEFVVDRSTDGGLTFGTRLRTITTSTGGAFQTFSVELGGDEQPDVRFGFGIETNGAGQADGVYVDDVSVTRCVQAEAGDGDFALLDGTSMATPHVTGAAALLLGRKPSLTVAQLRSALLDTGEPIAALSGKTVTGRRLNVDNAIRSAAASAPPPAPVAESGDATGVSTSGVTLNGTLNPRGVRTSWLFEYGPTAAYGASTTLVDAGAAARTQAVSTAIGGLLASTTYHYRLVALRGAERFPGADRTFTTATPSLSSRAKAARVACGRKRGKYRCRVSLTRGSALKARLVLKRGRKVLARGSGRVGTLIELKGKKAKAGRFKITLTLVEGSKKASSTKRVRVR